ncbi:MAG: group II intron reverse transcriptase/maturase [Candidatus Cloacimonetes bacterium]|nr:group II intron reverse transcriptase/maturase [Candidatus Cloacimonadota bacterium]
MGNDLTKITELSKRHKTVQGIMCYINESTLLKQHRKQENKKASGIDGITKTEYGKNLQENLTDLINRMKRMSYRPQAVRRTYIPKTGSKELRPLGIPSYEDKLVQGAMADVLTAIYEPLFLDISYGFRPNRSCHQAIKRLDEIIMKRKVNYIVDADIKGFFDNVDHKWLVKFLEHKIQDPKFIRYIVRFLKAGIMEEMQRLESDKGTPQGGLISPILANIYLHYVLDLWFVHRYVKTQCRGEAYIVRYADDFVCCFEFEEDAWQFYEELKVRLSEFGLSISETKSKIIPFGRNTSSKETFDFLGFTHINGLNRKGYYKLVHITCKKKSQAKKQAIKAWIKASVMILPIPKLIKKLNIKLSGMFRYYGISDNTRWMTKILHYVKGELHKWLNRRSQKRKLNWDKFNNILKYNPIVQPKIYFSLWQSQ